MNDSSNNQADFSEKQKALINQIRAETKAKWKEMPIHALRLSPSTRAYLHRAGFRTLHHILHPTPEQLMQVKGITSETKQEIRENLKWAIGRWKRYFRRLVIQSLRDQSADSTGEITPTISPSQSKELTTQANHIPDDRGDYLIADDVYALLFPVSPEEEPYVRIRIEAMSLSGRTYNALIRSHITTVGQLVPLTVEQLLQFNGIGSLSAAEIMDEIARFTRDRSERVISNPLLGELKTISFLANRSLEELALSKRTKKLLNISAFTSIGQLVALTRPQLDKLAGVRHLSNKAVEEILGKLATYLVLLSQETEDSLAHLQPTIPTPEIEEFSTDKTEVELAFVELPPVLPEIGLEILSTSEIDVPLDRLGLFSPRVKNALMRRGIFTLRLLLMHTPEFLRQQIKNLGDKGLAEIEQAIAQFGWALAEKADVNRVTLNRLLTAVFYKVDNSLSLADLTLLVNRHSKPRVWSEESVADAAAHHPYIVATANGRYQFQILQSTDTPLYLEPERQLDILPEPIIEATELEVAVPYLMENQHGLDELLESAEMFSKRVANALVHQGIITPRLLLMHTPELLLQEIRNLGSKGIAEIEEALASKGWQLAKATNVQQVILYRLLAAVLYKFDRSIELPTLTDLVNRQSKSILWTEAEVALGAAEHPYIVAIEDGCYLFKIHPVDIHFIPPAEDETDLSGFQENLITSDGKLMLARVWRNWIAGLKDRPLEVLFLRYGVWGDEALTLEEIGQQLGVTRARVQQIEAKALAWLKGKKREPYYQPLYHLLAEGVQQAGELLMVSQWEGLLDEKTVWGEKQIRPSLLSLLCAVFEDFSYHNSYQVVTKADIKTEQLRQLGVVFKRILHAHKGGGLEAEQLIATSQQQMKNGFPSEMHEPSFILAAVDLFERVGLGANKRYVYIRKEKKLLHPKVNTGWTGRPGTRLHEWELRLRAQFEKVAWIGQVILSEADFAELCQVIQTEAQAPHYLTSILEGQPRLVPPAVFMATLVFAARYSQQNADEFWVPYLQTVWQVEYTQAFIARCRRRFMEVVPYLEQTFGFEFPRQTEGDLVAAVYRHALLPRYVQDDLALWLREQWQAILPMADVPDLLMAELYQDKKLDYLPRRLQNFIRGKATETTAVSLISNMAAAISLHVNEGETVEAIRDLLADIPIEQELWDEVAKAFADAELNQPAPHHQTKPRLNWVWSSADNEMVLRVQNIVLSPDSNLEGEPDRLIWLESAEADPLTAEIEVEISPWRMHTGERVINDVFLSEPDGPLAGQLLLLTDMDEEAVRLDVPQFPSAAVQFFRPTQQGAYGIPVEPSQVTDGIWLVMATGPLTFLDEEEEVIEPDVLLDVPYPLNKGNNYQWAAQLTLTLPVTIKMGATAQLELTTGGSAALAGRPSFVGARPIPGLSRHVQPTYANTQVSLVLAEARERLLKQASLWLRGQTGWRWQRPLAELLASGIAKWVGSDLHIQLQNMIPAQPDFYLVELRASLQPLLPAPLQFAVVPGLEVEPPPDDQLYTPANPPEIVLYGVDESVLVHREGLQVRKRLDGRQTVTWHDLRHEPRLTLRFDKVDIPLAWGLPHFMAWIEPKPTKPYLTLTELQECTLNAVGTKTAVSEFRLSIPGLGYRPFSLRNGRYANTIGQSQLYDMVRLAEIQPVEVNVQVGAQTWLLLEVRQRPSLAAARLAYESREQTIHFYTGLDEEWSGDVRFVAESLSNPFASPVELSQANCLQAHHRLPGGTLPPDLYLLLLELDGVQVPLDESAMRFTVGPPIRLRAQTRPLVQEIRSGTLIPAHQAEDFVLLWAENAQEGNAELTATTLYQLATIPATALENFDFPHLRRLWPPLDKLKAVQNGAQWVADHGYLPAWILLDKPLILRTAEYGYQLRVYPVQAAHGGREGRGYGRWHMSTVEGAPKELVYLIL
ncbi:MAG: hypothetical protein H6653_07815 [Ardenticatenaceae bacterium]|nr:hypothetical protein [Ardenticatenaceae bacterium]